MDGRPPRELEDPDYLGRPFPRTRYAQYSRRAPGCVACAGLLLVTAGLAASSLRGHQLVAAAVEVVLALLFLAGVIASIRAATREDRDRRYEEHIYR